MAVKILVYNGRAVLPVLGHGLLHALPCARGHYCIPDHGDGAFIGYSMLESTFIIHREVKVPRKVALVFDSAGGARAIILHTLIAFPSQINLAVPLNVSARRRRGLG